MNIKDLIEEHKNLSIEKGFGYDKNTINIPEKFALIHSEVAEAYEAYRKKRLDGKDGLPFELADIIIRVVGLAGAMDIDIEKAIREKMDINWGRTWDKSKLNESLSDHKKS